MSEGEDTQIRQLDQATVERIAAGEVVERPASVVKELVENALDAEADRVTVAVERGGIDGIRVTDDGIGMGPEAVERAVEEHTTSKIASIDDLERGVGTLGFRGEALHAIGAVSRMTITTRPRAGDATAGTCLRVEGGDVTDVDPAGCPVGTTIEVEDLFYNVPARRKYLKQASTEFAHVNTVVTSYALANPDVAVTLEHDGRETFATTGQGNLAETVLSVYGREVAESMIEVDGASLPDGPLESVTGLVSHPETNRASRDYLSTYVNGRYVRADAIRAAIVNAYDTQLAPDRYPFAVVFCEVDPATVDVNVHPRKMEVRFAAADGVRQQVEHAVESALLDSGLLRSGAPRGRSAPEQTEITPESGQSTTEATAQSNGEREDEQPGDGRQSSESASTASPQSGVQSPATSHEEPTAQNKDESASQENEQSAPRKTASHQRPTTAAGGDSTAEAGTDGVNTDDTSDTTPDGVTSRPSPDIEPTRSSAASATSDATSSLSTDPSASRSPVTNDPDTQTTLSGDEAHPSREYDNFPDLRVLGQLHDTYIIAEADDGLVLIDQHAADERINYERLTERFEGNTTTQALADPVELELTAREVALFDDYQDALARLGFHANLVDDRVVEVTTVPGLVAEAAGPSVIRDVLSELVGGKDAAENTVEAVADELLSDMACYPSITGNTSLTDGSVVDLLSTLDDCENPWACPHGRPVLIHFDSDEIDDRFERDYPGH